MAPARAGVYPPLQNPRAQKNGEPVGFRGGAVRDLTSPLPLGSKPARVASVRAGQHPSRWRWPSGTARARPAPGTGPERASGPHRSGHGHGQAPHQVKGKRSRSRAPARQAAQVASIRAGWHQAPSTQHQAPSTKHQAPSTQHPAPSTQHPAAGAGHRAPHGQGQHLQGTGPARSGGPHRSGQRHGHGHGQAPHQVKGFAPLPPIHFAVMRTELSSGLGFQRGGLFNPPPPHGHAAGHRQGRPHRWHQSGRGGTQHPATGEGHRAGQDTRQGTGPALASWHRHRVKGWACRFWAGNSASRPGTMAKASGHTAQQRVQARQAARVASVEVGQHQTKGG